MGDISEVRRLVLEKYHEQPSGSKVASKARRSILQEHPDWTITPKSVESMFRDINLGIFEVNRTPKVGRPKKVKSAENLQSTSNKSSDRRTSFDLHEQEEAQKTSAGDNSLEERLFQVTSELEKQKKISRELQFEIELEKERSANERAFYDLTIARLHQRMRNLGANLFLNRLFRTKPSITQPSIFICESDFTIDFYSSILERKPNSLLKALRCGETTGEVSDYSLDDSKHIVRSLYCLSNFVGESSNLNYLLHACGQQNIFSWSEFGPFEEFRKIGEGTFGEVFKTSINDLPVALKIIPFTEKEGGFPGLVNGEHMKSSIDILPELLITRELSKLAKESNELRNGFLTPNYTQLLKAAVVQGEYPVELLLEWDRFHIAKKSLNDRPNSYASPEQLFILFALSFGGRDLESTVVKDEHQAFSIFFQIAISLMVAEEVLEFEHRDLHWGNVLIESCRIGEPIRYLVNEEEVAIKSQGVRVSIIDFTNSRMKRGGTTIFLNLSSDEELFKGRGDYQFDIYRLMRAKNNDEWKIFTPYTNVLWLHYIATKVFSSKKIVARRRKEIIATLDRILQMERVRNIFEDEEIGAIFEKYKIKIKK